MYVDHLIHSANLADYYDHIPEYYRALIRTGKASAVATYDGGKENGALVGVTVTGNDAGWLDIVWISMGEKYVRLIQRADFLLYILQKAERSGNYYGAYVELHEDESTQEEKDVLYLAGMELRKVRNNLYECRLSDLKKAAELTDPGKELECIFLKDTPEEFLDTLAEKMEDDERPVPIPSFPDWDKYLAEVSLVCVEKDVPVGTLLISEEKDYLVLSLCYSVSATHMAVMLRTAYLKAAELFPDDKRILIPIVGMSADKIVEKLAPTAKRGSIIQAVTWFDKTSQEDMDPVMKQMLGL